MSILVHPSLLPITSRSSEIERLKNAVLRHRVHQRGMGAGFLEDLGDSIGSMITGLAEAMSGAITATINTIKKLGETIALIVRAAIGDISWDRVLRSLGEVFQDVGQVLYYLNPVRYSHEWLKEAPLTKHAFNELDKFTGGMLTTAANLSDLPFRAMRGDPISKAELIADALLAFQIAAVVFTGGGYLAIGLMVGTMVGRQVCSKQTQAKEACMAAFQIVGAAVGGWASGSTWGAGIESGFSAAEEQAWLSGDQAYAQFIKDQASSNLLTHLSSSASKYLTNAGIDQATQQAVLLCQTQKWAGRQECAIIGQVANNYLSSEGDEPFEDFLAREVARIGAEQLMLQWFPPDTKEHQAIQWQIKYTDMPVDQTVIVKKEWDTKTLLALVGGLAIAAVGLTA
ncbi:MAG: hypothetical protein HC883_00210 [Bdellovibrionaceae bacterium]|nr:hypothetical protein [Pseudobdellovibrionaceae bacterium]